MKKHIKLIIFLLVIITMLSGCSNKNNNEEKLASKTVQELNYIDDKIVTILNKLNNISLENYIIVSSQTKLTEQTNGEGSGSSQSQSSSSEENNENNSKENNNQTITTTQMQPQTVIQSLKKDIDWSNIENDIEILNTSWDIILLDLYSSNINDNDILEFSRILDLTIIGIKNKNKQEVISNLAKLYSYIPKYLNQIEGNTGRQKAKQTKSYLINAYALIDTGNWTEINNNITECDNSFKGISNDIDYSKNKEYKINKTYVLIKELQNSLNTKDSDVFYIKYKNLIQSINTL